MSARVLRFADYSPKRGEFCLLLSDLPGHGIQTIGVLLLDTSTDNLHIRLRRDLASVAAADDIEVLEELAHDLERLGREQGGKALLDRLETEASLGLRVTDREAVTVSSFERTLNDLYREHVPAQVLQFRTHLPRFALAVAAGPFLTNPEDVTADEWIETPEDLRLDDNMFVARIQGHSMEPRIPDGALCVFRRNVVGSRNNRLVLVRNSELADDNQYTVKRYKSEKQIDEEGFQQTRIRLESLNPAYPSWDLDIDENKYQIVAEFVRVLE